MDKSRFPSCLLFFLLLFLLTFNHRNFVQSETGGLSDQKQDKLISILENLQLSIKEILTNIGPNTVSSSSSSSPQSPATSFRSSSSAAVSVTSKSTGGSSRTPFSQRPEPPDYPSQNPKDEVATPPGPVSDRDAPPSGRSTSDGSTTSPKKYGPGVPFRVSKTLSD